MNQNQKKLQMNRALSIALSLLVVVAVFVTIIAVSAAKRNKPNNDTASTTSKTTQSTSRTTASTSASEKEPPNTSVGAEKVTFVSPMTAGNIIKEWSADVPVFSNTMEDYRLHLGVDISAASGTPVYAVADGTVESVEFHPMMGQTVVITHANGYKSVYQNMQTSVPSGIQAGVTVKAGDAIGAVGDTALIEISEDPHLHFELYKEDVCQNPLSHFTVIPIDPSTDYED